ncbi:MAG: PKD domain-containing protein [Thermoplasmatota archaeon]
MRLLILLAFVLPVSGEAIHVEPAAPQVGEVATFSDSAQNLTWDFGDGATAEGTPALHTFTLPGVYPVELLRYGIPVAQVTVTVPIPSSLLAPAPASLWTTVTQHPLLILGAAGLVALAAVGVALRSREARPEDPLLDSSTEAFPATPDALLPEWEENPFESTPYAEP